MSGSKAQTAPLNSGADFLASVLVIIKSTKKLFIITVKSLLTDVQLESSEVVANSPITINITSNMIW
ncbi:hypothetical protein [Dulcicalothrix desertica]|uniref:hypothetical protein n=1 Tax=Dulcicalothrix desertica TaxID=32056 RepID=UPI0011A69D88|nr:hypothetical protein [Dulcicalothrix desertica]